MDTKNTKMFKKLLNDQLQALLKGAKDTVEEMSEEEETFADVTDRATVEMDRSFELRIRDRERKLISKIKEALQRIDREEFGICESCGGKISVARLKARPVTTLCIDCKTEAEEKEKEPA